MPHGFQWPRNAPFPEIEDHTLRKLEVLRKYLDVYFDTVAQNPRMDRLNITLVDGFCGGGAYQRDNGVKYGSPIILLKAVRAARERLNANREKRLELNARFVFVDAQCDHVASLEEQIRQAGFGDQIGRNISMVHGTFTDELPGILDGIRHGQRAGRSIFVLDQCGWSDVPMSAVHSIFTSLQRPEVVMTFAIDGLLNYLREESSALAQYRQFGIDDDFIAEWNARKSDEALGRLVTQRVLMTNIHQLSGAAFFTPFMLWSITDNRWMMMAHLSNHQAARDKMLGVHWDSHNSFRHVGKGSLFFLGFDTRLIESKDALFNFGEQDLATMNRELCEVLPGEIEKLTKNGPVEVKALLEQIGNRTAARNQDIFRNIEDLAGRKEITLLSRDGAQRRQGSQVKLTDQLILPTQGLLFPFPR